MTPAEKVATWNANVKVGAKVFLGPGFVRFTRAAAQVLSDGRAVVWLDTYMGAVDLDRVRLA